MEVNIIRCTENPIDAIASAFAITRGLSYKQYLEKYTSQQMKENLIKDCALSGHWSGFEFVDIDVEVLGFSRVFEVDCVRTRISSPMIEAGKFTDKRNFESVIPDCYDKETAEQRLNIIRQWNEEDKQKGIDPRIRRYWTHQGLSRYGRFKRNLRTWIETSQLRMCMQTQWEYRMFMDLLKKEVEKHCGTFLASYLKPKCEYLGYCNEQFEPCGMYEVKSF